MRHDARWRFAAPNTIWPMRSWSARGGRFKLEWPLMSKSFAPNPAWTTVRQADFQDNQVGLQIQIPIGNEAARSTLRGAIARRLQQLATKAQREAQIEQEVYNAVDTLETDWQRIVAARQRVVLAART